MPKVCFTDTGEWKQMFLHLMSLLFASVDHNTDVLNDSMLWPGVSRFLTRPGAVRAASSSEVEIDCSQKKSPIFFTIPAKMHLTDLLLLQLWTFYLSSPVLLFLCLYSVYLKAQSYVLYWLLWIRIDFMKTYGCMKMFAYNRLFLKSIMCLSRQM